MTGISILPTLKEESGSCRFGFPPCQQSELSPSKSPRQCTVLLGAAAWSPVFPLLAGEKKQANPTIRVSPMRVATSTCSMRGIMTNVWVPRCDGCHIRAATIGASTLVATVERDLLVAKWKTPGRESESSRKFPLPLVRVH
jgi:hypothetical protein